MAKKSLLKKIARMLLAQTVLLLMILIICFWGIWHLAENKTRTELKDLLAVYGTQLEDRLEEMDRTLGIVITDNPDLEMLNDSDELERYYASVRLWNSMNNILNISDSAELIVVAQGNYDMILTSKKGGSAMPGDGASLEERELLQAYTMNLAKDGAMRNGGWAMLKVADKIYICKNAVINNRAVSVYLNVKELMKTQKIIGYESKVFLLTDQEGTVCGIAGNTDVVDQKIEKADEIINRSVLAEAYELQDGTFRVYAIEKIFQVYRQVSYEMLVLLLSVAILYLVTIYIVRSVRCSLIWPMQSLTEDMKTIREGDYELRISENSDIEEFYLLSSSFNQLLDEIIQLKIQYYEKRLELQEADQKYIRMQLRPHFFLNAMATVSALSTQGKNQEIRTYVEALSKNIRYMFSSGLHTVMIKEELRHVQNYLEMQELKYPNCVFSYMELPQELEEWRIPQMLIHTLIENEYKYAISRDAVLMLLIRVSAAEYEGERMLLIEIEDDGMGYPADVMRYVNQENGQPPKDGSRVGLWSIRRLMELMYDRKGLFQIANLEPHGAVSRIFVPEATKHEIQIDGRAESGIK